MQNEILYKKQRNKCVALRRICFKGYFSKITKNGIAINKNVWKSNKPFLTNDNLENPEIILQDKGNRSDELVLVKLFNEHYINIAETLCGA